MTTLRGLTWDHTRGYAPLVAASAVYRDTVRPDVDVAWDRRSLWAFGEAPLEEVAPHYDLLIVDHPLLGSAAKAGLVVPLDDELPEGFLADLSAQSVGPSYRSYTYEERQWALPVDASGQTAAVREDLLDGPVPATWDDVLALAATGRVALPLAPIDALSSFFTLCASLGAPCFQSDGAVVDRQAGRETLSLLARLVAVVPADSFDRNPIRLLNRMSAADDVAYCPLLYAYSNYRRDDFAPHRVRFVDVPSFGAPGQATLGGAGIAVSSSTRHRAEALEFAAWVAHAERQRTVYALSGGQPGNRVAWEDEVCNRVTNGFYRDVLPTLDRAYLRPNAPGFDRFQADAGPLIVGFLRGAHDPEGVLDLLDETSNRTMGGAEEEHRT